MKLYLVRHGQTDYNVQGILNDNILRPVPLNATGVVQVKKTAKELKNKGIEVIFSSPFLRTKQTAELISKEIDAPIIQDIRLQEHIMGMDGKSYLEWKKIKQNGEHWKLPQGESYNEMKERIQSFLYVLKKTKHKAICIVSHESPLLTIQAVILGKSYHEYKKMHQNNAEIVELIY